ncbi:XRE family transcriptional regulator [Fructobacillus tropaeoli]|uniref:SOS-response transcriptional repressor LexA (RecA-mediated autopeptidase) (LexA) n=1 Tax=Fructobacillus tropaeoli TaxID=709323 RepID=A0ABM9MNM2_9LACO|nr:SOS-response transcriptional repressor LexA (RecA-mediated autopeptidase) (LexA) [Fructobacillus tropaeoli]CAK1234332.1 SOS-response transcriptional repressor LexA (RecA-mediated autopeptidase) (LexA) [Fructobacillus tropaeoli]
MNFGNELRQMRKSKGLTIGQLSAYTGLNSGFISQVETGKRNTPKIETLDRIAKGLRISHEEILKMAGIFDTIPDNISNQLPISSTPSTVSIPIYGRISAGYPEGAKEDIAGEVEVPNKVSERYSSNELIALRVNGESMNKVIPNGTVAILAKVDLCEITNGDICGVIIDGESATLKHVYQYPDRIRFEPDSWLPNFKPFEYSKEDVDNGQPPIQIIGKLIHMQSSF